MTKKLLLFLFPLTLFSQVPTIQWDKTVGGSNTEFLTSIKNTSDGGFILCGSSNSPVSGEKSQEPRGLYDYWLAKTDANGILLWEKTYGGLSHDYGIDVIVSDDGGYLIAGSSYSDASGDKTEATRGHIDYWLLKLDVDGNLAWQKAYGGSFADELGNIIKTSDGYLLCGSSNSPISGDKNTDVVGESDLWLVKINLEGEIIWQKTYGGSSFEQDAYGATTIDGGFIIGCHSRSGISGDRTLPSSFPSDAWILKLDENGDLEWQTARPMTEFNSVRQIGDEGYLIAGKDRQQLGRNELSFTDEANVIKLDEQGNQLWQYRSLPIYGDCTVTDLFEETDGGFVLSIECTSTGANSCVSKISADGAFIWNRTFAVNSYTWAYGIQKTDDGFAVGLQSSSDASTDKTENSRGSYDFWLVKFGPQLTIDSHINSIVSVFPNPVTDRVNILNAGESHIDLYNSLGQRVFSTSIQHEAAQIDFPFPHGTYFLKITGITSQTVKIVK